jgi:hypothetical protein
MMRKCDEPRTSKRVKRLAGKALEDPRSVSDRQVQSLAGSTLAHIEPRYVGRRLTPRGGSKRQLRRR